VEAWDCAPGCPAAELDRQSGRLTSGAWNGVTNKARDNTAKGAEADRIRSDRAADDGGASRFFPVSQWSPRDLEFGFRYHAKATAAERPGKAHEDDEAHPTVKPLGVMLWLARLVCPPGGTVVDPFAGTGTTLEAAALLGLRGVGAENDPKSCKLATERLSDIGGRDRKIRARRPRKARAGQDALW
jgi:DNA modification methylase